MTLCVKLSSNVTERYYVIMLGSRFQKLVFDQLSEYFPRRSLECILNYMNAELSITIFNNRVGVSIV